MTQASFREATAERRVQAVPMSHLSVELGHLYLDDYAAGPEHLRRQFARVAPWVEAVRALQQKSVPGKPARISTCFLVDDYFAATAPPATVLPQLLRAAGDSGLEINYLARESACADADGVPLARLVEERIVADPPPDSTGVRPPVSETGWLSNGQRSPATTGTEAMDLAAGWAPPVQNATTRHSVFVDVELWDQRRGKRIWSCAFLAAVWQLLRLGLLRDQGAQVAVPRPWQGAFPDSWEQLPAVIQLTSRAAPFSAYRTLSLLANRFLTTEHAVRTILSQVAIEPTAARQVIERARAESVSLPVDPIDRMEYVFTG